MIENGKTSPYQFKLLVILCFIGTSILYAPGIQTLEAKQDAWIASILGLVGALSLVYLYNTVGNLFPKMTLVESTEKLLGKWLGKIVALLFVSFLFINCSLIVWLVGDFVTTQMMPETPIQYTHILLVVIVIVGTRLGLETFAKAAEILYPWVIGLIIIFLLFLCKDMEFQNIQPVFEYGIKPIIKGSLLYVSYSSLTLIALMMIFPAYVNNLKEAKKSFLIGTLIGGIIVFFITVFCILVLGYAITAQNAYPAYMLAKKINIGNFIERLESIITILWLITIFYKIILYFYGAVIGLAQILKLKDYRPLTLPLGMILIVLSLIVYPDSIYANLFNTTTWLSFSLTNGFFLPLLLLVIGKVRKRKV